MHTPIILLNRSLTLRTRLRIRKYPIRILRLGGVLQHPFLHRLTNQRTMRILQTLPTKPMLTNTNHIIPTRLKIILEQNRTLAPRPRAPFHLLTTLNICPQHITLVSFPFLLINQLVNHTRPNRSLTTRLRTPQTQTPRPILNRHTYIPLPTHLTKPMITPTRRRFTHPKRLETNPTINNNSFIWFTKLNTRIINRII
ncbi:hypothetical protein HanXRQr2_Chr11g0468941 [Helianthus annuus]|uniref:Uncharacterized protein n=1 Tax=Helianthus annuus TaxID=4232 RepID=A0A9K3MYB6_HELAN|nr:hypothetical protein HanXRQr2_Chr11g0468941 [Helianthus annuus]